MRSAKPDLWMVTENKHKFREGREILASFGLPLKQDRTAKAEIQSEDLGAIALHALLEARSHGRKDRGLIVEDSGLFIDFLAGFPGPYSSYAYKTIGVKGILRLLGKTTSRKAHFESAIALSTPHNSPRLFTGRVSGRISLEARGREGFGFDPIFVPEGSAQTFGELGAEFKGRSSHRAAAFRRLAVWVIGSEPSGALK